MAANKKKSSQNGTHPPGRPKPKGGLGAKVQHWFRELVRHELLTMIGHAIGWLFSNLTYIVPILIGLYTAAAQIITGIANASASYPITQYIVAHPIRVSVVAGIIAAATPLIRVLFGLPIKAAKRFFAYVNADEDTESESSPAEQLVQAVGVSAFYPHATKAEKNKEWKACVGSITSHHARDLRIMGATGWNTFGDQKSPLHKLLSGFDGEVKVLLMLPDPKLPALARRAKETGRTPEEYVAEIWRSIERIRTLRSKGKSISLKFYTQTPIWKMLISNDFMWLQHYCKAIDVEDTPVYVFFSDGDGGTSLFHPLYSVWLKRWERDDNKQCQFIEPCIKNCAACGIPSTAPAVA